MRTIKIKGALVASSLTAVAVCTVAVATGASATPGDPHRVWICHATHSETNPYVQVHVDVASASYKGHLAHENDIIGEPGAENPPAECASSAPEPTDTTTAPEPTDSTTTTAPEPSTTTTAPEPSTTTTAPEPSTTTTAPQPTETRPTEPSPTETLPTPTETVPTPGCASQRCPGKEHQEVVSDTFCDKASGLFYTVRHTITYVGDEVVNDAWEYIPGDKCVQPTTTEPTTKAPVKGVKHPVVRPTTKAPAPAVMVASARPAELAHTGTNPLPLVGVGLGLLLAGLGALRLSRRSE